MIKKILSIVTLVSLLTCSAYAADNYQFHLLDFDVYSVNGNFQSIYMPHLPLDRYYQLKCNNTAYSQEISVSVYDAAGYHECFMGDGSAKSASCTFEHLTPDEQNGWGLIIADFVSQNGRAYCELTATDKK